MPPEIYVSLVLTGSFDPSQVEMEIGLPCETRWREGEFVPKTKLVRKTCGVILSIPKERTFDLEPQMHKLLDFLAPKKEAILEVARKYCLAAEIGCAICSTGEFPSVHFESKTLTRIQEFNAEIDIDIIFLGMEDG